MTVAGAYETTCHLTDAMRALQLGCSTLTTPQTKKGVTAAYMKQFIGCDAHKKYSVFVAVNEPSPGASCENDAHSSPSHVIQTCRIVLR
jgi:hypothetical protein